MDFVTTRASVVVALSRGGSSSQRNGSVEVSAIAAARAGLHPQRVTVSPGRRVVRRAEGIRA